MSHSQILDIIHADDTVEAIKPNIVLVVLLAVEKVGGDFVLVHEVDHLLARKAAVAEEVVVVVAVLLSFALGRGGGCALFRLQGPRNTSASSPRRSSRRWASLVWY